MEALLEGLRDELIWRYDVLDLYTVMSGYRLLQEESCADPVRDAFMAEALSCLQAVTIARELGFNRVVFEGDSRTVIQKCQLEHINSSLISPVMADVKSISRVFMDVAFFFVRREANMAAHTLA
ncbi:hypothetical protein V6N13_105087 [Hibiscus sabdariffa]